MIITGYIFLFTFLTLTLNCKLLMVEGCFTHMFIQIIVILTQNRTKYFLDKQDNEAMNSVTAVVKKQIILINSFVCRKNTDLVIQWSWKRC